MEEDHHSESRTFPGILLLRYETSIESRNRTSTLYILSNMNIRADKIFLSNKLTGQTPSSGIRV